MCAWDLAVEFEPPRQACLITFSKDKNRCLTSVSVIFRYFARCCCCLFSGWHHSYVFGSSKGTRV